MNTLQNTFNKHLKLLHEHFNLKEGADKSDIDDKINFYKKNKKIWQMAGINDYKSMMDAGKFGEFEEYYPGWSMDDLNTVYKALEGEYYTPDRSAAATDAGTSDSSQSASKEEVAQAVEQTINDYKADKRKWDRMAKGDYESMISAGEIFDEFKEYYPGWNIDDIKAVYRGVEGKNYK